MKIVPIWCLGYNGFKYLVIQDFRTYPFPLFRIFFYKHLLFFENIILSSDFQVATTRRNGLTCPGTRKWQGYKEKREMCWWPPTLIKHPVQGQLRPTRDCPETCLWLPMAEIFTVLRLRGRGTPRAWQPSMLGPAGSAPGPNNPIYVSGSLPSAFMLELISAEESDFPQIGPFYWYFSQRITMRVIDSLWLRSHVYCWVLNHPWLWFLPECSHYHCLLFGLPKNLLHPDVLVVVYCFLSPAMVDLIIYPDLNCPLHISFWC